MALAEFVKPIFYRPLLSAVPSLLFRIQHYRMHRRFGGHTYWANLKQPSTFNECLLKKKLDPNYRTLGHLVDKAEVKPWVAERIGIEHLIPTLAVYDSEDQVDLAAFERPCILKPTHASGKVIILRENEPEPDIPTLRRKMRSWLKTNHYFGSGEPQYRDLRPRIIAEPLLGAEKADLPDYKFFCFHGEPIYIQVDLDRHTRHVRRYYDVDWQPQAFTLRYPMADGEVSRPAPFERMLEIAKTLSSGFDFVRVDLYAIDDQIFFGELTFHPESGSAPFSDYATDLRLGALIRTPDLAAHGS